MVGLITGIITIFANAEKVPSYLLYYLIGGCAVIGIVGLLLDFKPWRWRIFHRKSEVATVPTITTGSLIQPGPIGATGPLMSGAVSGAGASGPAAIPSEYGLPPTINGRWRKTYTWQGKPGEEMAIINKGDYYIEGETVPHFWLRDGSYNPVTREVRFKMILSKNGEYWDMERLAISVDQRNMTGHSEKFGHEVRYERQFLPEEVGTSGQ